MELLYESSDGTAHELYHYGVLGMKWGVHKAARLSSRNERLARTALDYDKKAAMRDKKAEKLHSKHDLGRANKAAAKSAKYAKKAAKIGKKALNAPTEAKRDKLEAKAATLKYKAADKKRSANQLSKIAGYGSKAMNQSIKSDKLASKAAKARMKMANNQRYINSMNRKTSNMSTSQIEAAQSWIHGWDASSTKKTGAIAALTADEAKRLGLDDSTRVTGTEEANFWKELAKQYEN